MNMQTAFITIALLMVILGFHVGYYSIISGIKYQLLYVFLSIYMYICIYIFIHIYVYIFSIYILIFMGTLFSSMFRISQV